MQVNDLLITAIYPLHECRRMYVIFIYLAMYQFIITDLAH